MKLSLAWVFDHLEGAWQHYAINDLVSLFNSHCAKIESVTPYAVNLEQLSLAEVINLTKTTVQLYSAEWNIDLELPARQDAAQGDRFMITRSQGAYRWATLKDLGHDKEGYLTSLLISQKDFEGLWKHWFETEDYILEIENKSITHRPDLWCHRGIARELSLLINANLVDYKTMCAPVEVHQHDHFSSATPQYPWTLKKETPSCKRFGATLLNKIPSNTSTLWMSSRLLRVDARPINLITDATNYVMFDMGQPLHAFDTGMLTSHELVQKNATQGQKITLLDGKEVTLEESDISVSNNNRAIALAGIMGSLDTASSKNSQEFLIEAATYDGPTVRKTATRLKMRTESSARFEKSLDPNNVVLGLMRFHHLVNQALEKNNPSNTNTMHEIHVLGAHAVPPTISVSHTYIEKKLGITLESAWIIKTLQKLDFEVTYTTKDNTYTITVPTARSTKDVSLPEDIVEEIGRFWGYSNIPPTLKPLVLKATSLKNTFVSRDIKNYFAQVGSCYQLLSYALFDEQFIGQIGFEPHEAVELLNPISQNNRRLVTTLIPNILKGIAENRDQHSIRFFELNKVWPSGNPHDERRNLAGIIYTRHDTIDFYKGKQLLLGLFDLLELPVDWVKHIPDSTAPWFAPYQTAALICQGTHIGLAGKAHAPFLATIQEGDAFIFEINLDLLMSIEPKKKQYKSLPKYPGTHLDLSLLVPCTLEANVIEEHLKNAHETITHVELIDIFEKKEWLGKRSLTFRIYAQNNDRTLVKEDIDTIAHNLDQAARSLGATIR